MKETQIKWINCAKMVAILAVMIDHTQGILYTNPKIGLASYFSVSLFIIISGMTSYSSYCRKNTKWKSIHKCGNILLDYAVATFIYLVAKTCFFDLSRYVQLLVGFNASGPFYFVLLYIQLTLIARFMFNYLQRCSEKEHKGLLYEVWGFLGVIVVSYLTTNYTNIFNIYGGGGILLGGTYLILYYLGMFIMKHGFLNDISLRKSVQFMILFGGTWIIWWYFVLCPHRGAVDAFFPFGKGINPPGICLMISAVLMLGFLFGFFTLLQRFNVTKWLVDVTNQLGSHTLYIFLYHRFFLDFVLRRHVIIDNIQLKRIVYLSVMIGGSIMLNMLRDKITKAIKWINQD